MYNLSKRSGSEMPLEAETSHGMITPDMMTTVVAKVI